jgi:hypothetical protein
MRILHHNDADGYGAAAIVKTELCSVFDVMTKSHFVEYCHNGNINIEDEADFYKENDQLYIVDLALDETIFGVIKKAIDHNMTVVHIDHHISGDKYLNEIMSDEDKALYNDNVIRFYNNEYSGCMLTWIYSCMDEDDRRHPMDVPFDLSEDLAQVALYPDSDKIKVVGIPLAVRLIDDNDVWRHSLPESKLFAAAWFVYPKSERHPINLEFWNEMLYSGPKMAYDTIDKGEIIFAYQETLYKSAMANSFEVTIGEYKGIAVNCCVGNSRLFGDLINEYDFVCKYHQLSPDRWKYSFYSKEDGANCEELVKRYFNDLGLQGGHVHAASGIIDRNVFDKSTIIV